ncbi:MAG: hypothetical protein HN389_05100 [Clostridia bacterium]|jgi:hypothetical protein|nr:hypothetical protein [Clostridia bacterium]
MRNTLRNLIGAEIKKIVKTHDYWQIELDIGGVNCYNPLYHCVKNNSHLFEADFCSEYIGKKIVKIVYKDKKHLTMKFGRKRKLVISLLDQDWAGPEAFSVHMISGATIVVN